MLHANIAKIERRIVGVKHTSANLGAFVEKPIGYRIHHLSSRL